MAKLLHEFEQSLILQQDDSGISYGYAYMREKMAEHPEWKDMYWSFRVEESKIDKDVFSKVRITVEDPNAINWAGIIYALAAVFAIVLILYPWR